MSDAHIRELQRRAKQDITLAPQLEAALFRTIATAEDAEAALDALQDVQGGMNLNQLQYLAQYGSAKVANQLARIQAVADLGKSTDAHTISTWYEAQGYTMDPRSNISWISPLLTNKGVSYYRKVTFPHRGKNYKVFRGRPGNWVAIKTIPIKPLAEALRAAANNQIVQHALKQQKKTAQAERRRAKALDDKLSARAGALIVNSQLSPEERADILYLSLRDAGVDTPMGEYPAGATHRSLDTDLISPDAPPSYFESKGATKLPSEYEAVYKDPVLGDVPLRFRRVENNLVIWIGDISIDPLGMRMTPTLGLFGENQGISGYIKTTPDGLAAYLFMWIAADRRKGRGTAYLRLWCRILAAYGLSKWVGLAVGPEGKAALEALAKKEEIYIDGWYKSNCVVTCGMRDPKQMRLFE